MLSSMKSQIILNILLFLIPYLLNCTIVDEVLSEGYALIALRKTLNSSLLDLTWSGPQCLSNITSWRGLRCINHRVVSIKLEGLGLYCYINDPFILSNLTKLTYISFKNNSIYGNMFDFSSNLEIDTIDLSTNQFTGPISDSLLNLNLLYSLQFNDNKLDGPIPPFNQSSLKLFNVSHNNLNGEIPNTFILQSFDESSYMGNLDLCGPPSTNPCQYNTSKGFKFFSKSSLIVVFIILLVFGLVLFLLVIFALWKRSRRINATMEKSICTNQDHEDKEKIEEKIEERRKKIVFVNGDGGFDLDELFKASAENLGEGSFGPSYKAFLDDERAFVVKRVRNVSPLTDEEFGDHIRALANMKHPNLFPLLGYYYSMEEKLLVYSYAPNGNLFDRIHGGRGESVRIPFKWNSRLSVAKHIARALEYLHTNTKGPDSIPHGNLKSTNILLESDDIALVSDYGLMPLVPAILAPKRMAAYRSPEYQYSQTICRKSDVWSYGCLLLELVARKLNNSARSGHGGTGEIKLVSWVHRAVREEWTCEVFDAEIGSQKGANVEGMFKLLQVALWCCEGSVERRPEMAEVVREVEAIMLVDEEQDEVEVSSLERSFV